jgi:anti-sigma factor RsiW
MLTCQQLTELITEYTEGHLPLVRRLQFEMHLGMCRHCRAYLRQMKATVRTLDKLPQEPIPIPCELEAELLARFRGMSPYK